MSAMSRTTFSSRRTMAIPPSFRVLRLRRARRLLRDDDVALRRADDREQLVLLSLRYFEFIERRNEVVHHRIPLALGDVEVLVCLFHRTTGVHLRAAGDLPDEGGDVKLQ